MSATETLTNQPALTGDDVAHYLDTHPDFFSQHNDLIMSLKIPNPHGDNAISLSERQIGALREKMAQLEEFLAELMSIGEENDVTSARVHKLAVALLSAPDQAAVLRTLQLRLAGTFVLPHFALRLWGAMGEGDGSAFVPTSLEAQQFAESLAHPYCGKVFVADIATWFNEAAADIKSYAAVPLREGKIAFGLLVLGSEEEQRFFEGMGTQYLEWIGELVAAALLRTR